MCRGPYNLISTDNLLRVCALVIFPGT
uniref:Uncharacterized protein n=1 Tax=Anguilla anguilla TaxID=7936 RepID=A0A0E9PW22_ANGAN